jgi:hypothetical protein
MPRLVRKQNHRSLRASHQSSSEKSSLNVFPGQPSTGCIPCRTEEGATFVQPDRIRRSRSANSEAATQARVMLSLTSPASSSRPVNGDGSRYTDSCASSKDSGLSRKCTAERSASPAGAVILARPIPTSEIRADSTSNSHAKSDVSVDRAAPTAVSANVNEALLMKRSKSYIRVMRPTFQRAIFTVEAASEQAALPSAQEQAERLTERDWARLEAVREPPIIEVTISEDETAGDTEAGVLEFVSDVQHCHALLQADLEAGEGAFIAPTWLKREPASLCEAGTLPRPQTTSKDC